MAKNKWNPNSEFEELLKKSFKSKSALARRIHVSRVTLNEMLAPINARRFLYHIPELSEKMKMTPEEILEVVLKQENEIKQLINKFKIKQHDVEKEACVYDLQEVLREVYPYELEDVLNEYFGVIPPFNPITEKEKLYAKLMRTTNYADVCRIRRELKKLEKAK